MRMSVPLTVALAGVTAAQTAPFANITQANASSAREDGRATTAVASFLSELGDLPAHLSRGNTSVSTPRTTLPSPPFSNSTQTASVGRPTQPGSTLLPPTTARTTAHTASTLITVTSSKSPTTTSSATEPTNTPSVTDTRATATSTRSTLPTTTTTTSTCRPAPTQGKPGFDGAIAGAATVPPALTVVGGWLGYRMGQPSRKGSVLGSSTGMLLSLGATLPLVNKLITERTEEALGIAGTVMFPFAGAALGALSFGLISSGASDQTFNRKAFGGGVFGTVGGGVGAVLLATTRQLSLKSPLPAVADCEVADSKAASVARSINVNGADISIPDGLLRDGAKLGRLQEWMA